MSCKPENDERWSALVRGDLEDADADALLDHALDCPVCGAHLELVADVTATLRARRERRLRPRPMRRSLSLRSIAIATGSIAAVVALALWLSPVFSPRPDFESLADITPIPFIEGTLRGRALPGREERFQSAMAAYQDRDWSRANSELGALLAEDPDDDKLRVYIAIARLWLRDSAGALEVLAPLVATQAADRAAAEPLVVERALWYAGMAQLLDGDGAAARRTFAALESRGGSYRPNAAAILARLDEISR